MSFNVGKTGETALTHARIWHLVDAHGKDLDKLTARLVIALKGQYKPTFHPNVDSGDHVVVINSRDIKVEDPTMVYRWKSDWPGGKKELSFKEMLDKHPTLPILKSVYRQLSKETNRRMMMGRLHVFAGPDHPYEEMIFKDYTNGVVYKKVNLADLGRVLPKPQAV